MQQYAAKKQVGAHSLFLGQVRNDTIDGREVQAIEYTAYREMVYKQFGVLQEKLFDEFDITGLQVMHSLGTVECGGISLFVLTTSQHRKPAIAACAAAVDRIKENLPIWGKELFEGGGYNWKENRD